MCKCVGGGNFFYYIYIGLAVLFYCFLFFLWEGVYKSLNFHIFGGFPENGYLCLYENH